MGLYADYISKTYEKTTEMTVKIKQNQQPRCHIGLKDVILVIIRTRKTLNMTTKMTIAKIKTISAGVRRRMNIVKCRVVYLML